jgi:hypothetical protein
MKLARFRIHDWESFGLVEGDHVRVIQGSLFGEYTITHAAYPLDQVKLLPPTRPTSFWAVGLKWRRDSAHLHGSHRACFTIPRPKRSVR